MSLKENDTFNEAAQERLEDRKHFHNLESLLGIDPQLCKACKEPLGTHSVVDARLDSIEQFDVCINPSCKEFNKDLL